MLPVTKHERDKTGRPAPKRSGRALFVYLTHPLRDALDAMAEREGRSLTAEVSRALQVYLGANGLWPPRTG
jgi:hypothetical protein